MRQIANEDDPQMNQAWNDVELDKPWMWSIGPCILTPPAQSGTTIHRFRLFHGMEGGKYTRKPKDIFPGARPSNPPRLVSMPRPTVGWCSNWSGVVNDLGSVSWRWLPSSYPYCSTRTPPIHHLPSFRIPLLSPSFNALSTSVCHFSYPLLAFPLTSTSMTHKLACLVTPYWKISSLNFHRYLRILVVQVFCQTIVCRSPVWMLVHHHLVRCVLHLRTDYHNVKFGARMMHRPLIDCR